jgi:DNA polymerase III alpha subunit (gram-positive type)
MSRVRKTKQYSKCLDELRKRGKTDVYKDALVAEGEAGDGEIKSFNRTYHGENRLPDAEKYDLRAFHRLVVHKVSGPDRGRVFHFVGSHDETDQWLENHRKSGWPPEPGENQAADAEKKRREQENQRIKQELKKTESAKQDQEVQKARLEQKLRDRAKDLERAEGEKQELKEKQGKTKAQLEEALRKLDSYAEQQRKIESEKDRLEKENNLNREDAERLAGQLKEVAERQAHVEAERQQALHQQELLAQREQQLAMENERLQEERQQALDQLKMVAERERQLAMENERLHAESEHNAGKLNEIDTRVSQLERQHDRFQRQNRWPGVSAILVVVAALGIGLFLSRGCSGSENGTSIEREPVNVPVTQKSPDPAPSNDKVDPKVKDKNKQTPKPDGPPISPAEAPQYEGQVAIVRVVVKSSYDGFDWGFIINTEENFRHPDNFEVVIDKATAGAKYKAKGIANLTQYFKENPALIVTGRVEKYKDTRSGNQRYRIRVKDPEQIQMQQSPSRPNKAPR